jgi:amino acid transporter
MGSSGGAPTEASRGAGRSGALLLLLLDVASILAFVAIGLATHKKGESVGRIMSVGWPFLTGMAAGWVAGRAWRRPGAVASTGLATWLGSVGLGMALRVLAGQGTAAAFIVVALAFLGLTMLGWRVIAGLVLRRIPPPTTGTH